MKLQNPKTLQGKHPVVLASAILALALLLPPAVGRAEAPKSAEDAGWTLIFSDDFDREELGTDWVAVDGDWTIKDNSLRGSGTLLSAKGFPGDSTQGFLRLEFEATTDVKPIIFFPDRPPPEVSVGDISSILNAQPPDAGAPIETGYFFQFGGNLNTRNQIQKAGVQVASDVTPENRIVPDKKHHVVVENDQGTVRMVIDGKVVLEEEESESILGEGYDRIGFYFYTASKIDNLKLYVKRLPNGLDTDADY